MSISRRTFTTAMLGGAAFGVSRAFADTQVLPNRPIRLIVPAAPGGVTDLVGRAIASFMGNDLKQSFVVENRPGAGMAIGATAVAHAAPDGTSLILLSSSPLVLNPLIYKTLQYDPAKDFRYLSVIADAPYILLVRKSMPVTNVAELVKYAQTKNLTYGSAGVGSINHVTGEMFNYFAGLKLVHVPYTGSSPALTALLSGQIDVYFGEISTFLPYVQNGDFRALAVPSASRLSALPDVPTMIQSGYPNFIANSWFVVAAPAKIPEDIASALKASADKANDDAGFTATLQKVGLFPQKTRSTSEIDKMREQDLARWTPIIKAQKISIE